MNIIDTYKETVSLLKKYPLQAQDEKITTKSCDASIVLELQTLTITILENEIARLEGKKIKEGEIPKEYRLPEPLNGHQNTAVTAYNISLQDQINHYQEQLELLKGV